MVKCVICGGKINAVGNWKDGNNAEPIKTGRCCDDCNYEYVVPRRIGDLVWGSKQK